MKTCVLQLCRLRKPGREPGYFWILSMLLLFSHSVVSDSLRPHGLCSQPTRLLCPWDSRGKKYWSGLPFPSPGDLPGPRIEPGSPPLQADALPWGPLGRFARPLGIGASRGMGEGEERRQAPPRWGPSVPGGTSGALSQDGCVHFQLADTLSLRTRPRSAAGPWECGGRSSGQGQAELPPWKRATLAAGSPSEPGTVPSPPGCLVTPTAPPGKGATISPLTGKEAADESCRLPPRLLWPVSGKAGLFLRSSDLLCALSIQPRRGLRDASGPGSKTCPGCGFESGKLIDAFVPFLKVFPRSSAGKESACKVGDLGSIPGPGRSPGGGNGYPLQCSDLENSMDCIVHRVTERVGHD